MSLRAAILTREEYTNAVVAKWTTMFGSVPFTQKHLYRCIHYVRPQPEAAFRPLTNEILSVPYKLDFRDWIGNLFKPPLHDALKDLKPTSYYLNEGRSEPSLFRYEFELEGYRVTLVENFTTFLLTIRPSGFVTNASLNRSLVSDVLHRWINVRQTSRVDVAQSFKLPLQIRTGDVFTNGEDSEPWRMRSGRDHVVGFLSKEGICLIVFKVQEVRAAMGLPTNYNWVNEQMFEADGTTRMDHPKYFDQRPKAEDPKKP